MARPMIQVQEVDKEYGHGKNTVAALKDINIEIMEGEFVAVVGPSGCGKSTLLHVMAGLEQPTSGRILVDAVDVTLISERDLPKVRAQKIGFVFQSFLLIEDLTAFENVQAVLWPSVDIPKEKQEEMTLEVLREVDMLERRDHFPRQMSGGEQQRIAIARALVNNPPILFCDEPTGNLDSKTGENIMKIIANLNRERNMTVVLVTHNEDLVKFAKRTLRMRDGVIK
ncbi:MAG: ABC transporter ATP-binding protein [Candidatus Thorarchaeota archaeon]|nr:MAG: macrolide ABC transporter ATP-binding protein [Candidatus Thorarchaeota archaeon]RLI60117.1 MAG: macrolide ABC transporter ATP-binding protein [Candidatus Thorarchaeota archaeon]